MKTDLATTALFAIAEELREALDDPERDGYPWEHLGDAEKDVRVLLVLIDRLSDPNWCSRLEVAEQPVMPAGDGGTECSREPLSDSNWCKRL